MPDPGGRDPHDTRTIDLEEVIQEISSRDEKPKRGRGRPRKHRSDAARKAAFRNEERFRARASETLIVDLLLDLYEIQGVRALDSRTRDPERTEIRDALAAEIALAEGGARQGLRYLTARLPLLLALSDAYEAAVAIRLG